MKLQREIVTGILWTDLRIETVPMRMDEAMNSDARSQIRRNLHTDLYRGTRDRRVIADAAR